MCLTLSPFATRCQFASANLLFFEGGSLLLPVAEEYAEHQSALRYARFVRPVIATVPRS